jgi:hypothetical protein
VLSETIWQNSSRIIIYPMLENLGLITRTEIQKKSSHRLYDRNAGVVVLLENDENQHDWVPTLCDVKRMGECYETMAVGGNTLPRIHEIQPQI